MVDKLIAAGADVNAAFTQVSILARVYGVHRMLNNTSITPRTGTVRA